MGRRSGELKNIFNLSLVLFLLAVIPALLFTVPSSAAPTPSLSLSPPPVASDRAEIRREITRVKLMMSHNPGSAASYRSRLAGLYLQAGEPEKAITLYRYGIIVESTRASNYHRKIGDIYTRMGREALARIEYDLAASRRKSGSGRRLNRQIREWEEEGRDDLLLQHYLFLLWTKKESRNVYIRKIALLLEDHGDKTKADHYYRWLINNYRQQAAEKPERTLDYIYWIADIYEGVGDIASAEEEYDRAIQIEGESGGRALMKKAAFLSTLEETDRALELYQRAEMREGVDLVRLRLKVADLLEDKGDIPGSLLWMEKAAAVGDEESAGIKLDIARFHAWNDQPEEALAVYRETLGVLDLRQQAKVMEKIGRVLTDLDRNEEGARAYKKAHDLWREDLGKEPADESLLERLAELAERAGESEKSGEYYDELLVVYRDRMEAEPERSTYYHRKLGDLYRLLERYDEAAAHYRLWSRIEPSDPDPHYRLYRLYRDYFEEREIANTYRSRYRELRKKNLAPSALTLKDKDVKDR